MDRLDPKMVTMLDPSRSERDRDNGGAIAPGRCDDTALIEQLAEVSSRARRIMQEYNIGSGHICAMARRAEQTISDTALRAEFLRLLIDLHEFGREARQRGLLGKSGGDGGASPAPPPDLDRGTKLFAPTEGASDAVSDDASRLFFAFLDR